VNIKIELTYEQWDALTDLVEDKRDSWARIVADSVTDGTEKDRLARYASKYAEFDGLYRAVMHDSEAK
jgi:hypothetical protein